MVVDLWKSQALLALVLVRRWSAEWKNEEQKLDEDEKELNSGQIQRPVGARRRKGEGREKREVRKEKMKEGRRKVVRREVNIRYGILIARKLES